MRDCSVRRLRLWLALSVLVVLGLAIWVGIELGFAQASTRERIIAWFAARGGGFWQVLLLLVAIVIGQVLAIPYTWMAAAVALLLPTFVAVLVAWLGGVGGACLLYAMGHMLGHGLPARWGKGWLEHHDRRLVAHGWVVAFWLHAIPVAPALVVNLVFGASRVRFPAFVLGTTLGLLPIAATVVVVAQGLVASWHTASWWQGVGWVSAVLLLVGLVRLIKPRVWHWWQR